MVRSLAETAKLYAEAIWQAEVNAGNMSTKWPCTVRLESTVMAAGYAAAGVMGADFDGPVADDLREHVSNLRDIEHAKNLFGNLGFH